MAREAAIVAQRCMDAQETGVVNLSNCGLMSVPDALYLFLKNSSVTKVDLSHNQLKKIPAKLANAFSQIKELNASNNSEISSLPDEFSYCQNLSIINLSGNKFMQLPSIINTFQSLQVLDFSGNLLENLSDSEINFLSSINSVNLMQNKFTDDLKSRLQIYPNFTL